MFSRGKETQRSTKIDLENGNNLEQKKFKTE